MRSRFRQSERRRQSQLQRNETYIADDEIDGMAEMPRFEIAGVEAFDQRDAIIPNHHLTVTDLDSGHMGCALLKQYLREAASRGADIESVAALGRNAEMRKRVFQLQSRARYIVSGFIAKRDRRIG